MTAHHFYSEKHGDTPFLSRDAVERLMEDFADKRFGDLKKAKESFNTEQWANKEEIRKGLKKNGNDFHY